MMHISIASYTCTVCMNFQHLISVSGLAVLTTLRRSTLVVKLASTLDNVFIVLFNVSTHHEKLLFIRVFVLNSCFAGCMFLRLS